MAYINKIIRDNEIIETARKLSDINMLFQKISSAFRILNKGKLSDDIGDDPYINSQCNAAVIGETEFSSIQTYLNIYSKQ